MFDIKKRYIEHTVETISCTILLHKKNNENWTKNTQNIISEILQMNKRCRKLYPVIAFCFYQLFILPSAKSTWA